MFELLLSFLLCALAVGVHGYQALCPFHGGHIRHADSAQVLRPLLGAATFPSAEPPFVPGGPFDPLQELDEKLTTLYKASRTDLLNGFTDPLILSMNNSLILLQNRTIQATAAAVSPLGQSLKLVCHLALATFVALDPISRGVADAGAVQRAQQYLALAQSSDARQSLAESARHFTPAQTARSQILYKVSLEMLRSAVSSPTPVTVADVKQFAQTVTPLLLLHVEDFVAQSMGVFERAVRVMRQHLTPAQWNRSRTLILASHMPRQGLSFAQFMAKQYNVSLDHGYTDGARLIYCEALSTAQECLNLLSVHLQDGDVGLAFFNQTLRMHRDLLADATKKYLATHSTHE